MAVPLGRMGLHGMYATSLTCHNTRTSSSLELTRTGSLFCQSLVSILSRDLSMMAYCSMPVLSQRERLIMRAKDSLWMSSSRDLEHSMKRSGIP